MAFDLVRLPRIFNLVFAIALNNSSCHIPPPFQVPLRTANPTKKTFTMFVTYMSIPIPHAYNRSVLSNLPTKSNPTIFPTWEREGEIFDMTNPNK
jgi:hypothetical protein